MLKKKSNIYIKLYQNSFIKWLGLALVVALTLQLFLLGIAARKLYMVDNLEDENLRKRQDKEMIVSKFYNSLYNNNLLNELYLVTGDEKYLKHKEEIITRINEQFDSLSQICNQRLNSCELLDTCRFHLDLYTEITATGNNYYPDTNKFTEIWSVFEQDGELKVTKFSLQIDSKKELNEIINKNLEYLKEIIVKHTNKMVANDRILGINELASITKEKTGYTKIIKLLTVFSSVTLLLLIGLFIYLLVIPIIRPMPALQKLGDFNFTAINQNFEKSFIKTLTSGNIYIEKYSRYILVFPKGGFFPIEIITGLQKYCDKNSKECIIIDRGNGIAPIKNDLFLILDDKSLVEFLMETKKTGLNIGQDFGVISYGDSPLKQIIAGGISVIDFMMTVDEANEAGDDESDNIKLIKRGSA